MLLIILHIVIKPYTIDATESETSFHGILVRKVIS